MKRKWLKKTVVSILIIALVFSFTAVAFAVPGDGNEIPGNGNVGKPENSDDGTDDGANAAGRMAEKMQEFRAALREQLAVLRQLRKEVRLDHAANRELRTQIRMRLAEMKADETRELNEEQRLRLRNAVQQLKDAAGHFRGRIKGFMENWGQWHWAKEKLDQNAALAALSALEAKYRNMITAQDHLGDALAVCLAYLEDTGI